MRHALASGHEASEGLVGPVLESGAAAEAVVAAIRQTNPDVRLEHRGSYVRVLVKGRCLLARARVEQVLGTGFRLPGDLEVIMPSFRGRMRMTSDEVLWTVAGGEWPS